MEKKINDILSPDQQKQGIINEMFSIKRNENTRISAIFKPIFKNKTKKLNQNNIIKSLKDRKNLDSEEENKEEGENEKVLLYQD